MTRPEFCMLLVGAKNSAEVKLRDALSYAAQLSFKKIDAIESAQTDYNLSDAFLYLKMCHCTLELSGYGMAFVDTLEEIIPYLKYERQQNEWSVVDLAKRSHVSSKIIYAFEDGRCGLRIDTFLKLINTLDLTIQIN